MKPPIHQVVKPSYFQSICNIGVLGPHDLAIGFALCDKCSCNKHQAAGTDFRSLSTSKKDISNPIHSNSIPGPSTWGLGWSKAGQLLLCKAQQMPWPHLTSSTPSHHLTSHPKWPDATSPHLVPSMSSFVFYCISSPLHLISKDLTSSLLISPHVISSQNTRPQPMHIISPHLIHCAQPTLKYCWSKANSSCNQLSWHGRQTCVDCRKVERSVHRWLPASGSFFRSGWTSRSLPSLSNQPMSKSYGKRACNATLNRWIHESPFIPETDDDKMTLKGKLWKARDLYLESNISDTLFLLRCVLHDITDVPRISLVMEQQGFIWPQKWAALEASSHFLFSLRLGCRNNLASLACLACLAILLWTPNLQRRCLSLHLWTGWFGIQKKATCCMSLCNVLISYWCRPLDWYVLIHITYAAEGIQDIVMWDHTSSKKTIGTTTVRKFHIHNAEGHCGSWLGNIWLYQQWRNAQEPQS